jgi:acetyl-CoA acetyltransferase
MSQVYVLGVGMTPFGKHLDKTLKSLAVDAISQAVKDAGISNGDIQAAQMGSAAAGTIIGQVCVPGQMILRSMGIGKIPVVNVENACATAATAFQQAHSLIATGQHDIVLACGYEKLFHQDKQKTFSVFSGAVDVEDMESVLTSIQAQAVDAGVEMDMSDAGQSRSLFIDIYAAWALSHIKQYGTTQQQMAAVSSKNSYHGSLNPLAQYQQALSIEEVLSAKEVVWPLTLPMCSPIGDGAAAAILVSEKKARELGLSRAVKVQDSRLYSGWDVDTGPGVAQSCANELYESTGVSPSDISCVELHDASAISEIMYYEYLGLCEQGKGGEFVEQGHSRLGGKVPVNTSGGLMRKGHPIGATGIAQIYELVLQLRGEAGNRQVENANVALAENGGGYVRGDVAALALTLLSR